MTPDPHYADEQAREHDEHLAEQDALEREQDRCDDHAPARAWVDPHCGYNPTNCPYGDACADCKPERTVA